MKTASLGLGTYRVQAASLAGAVRLAASDPATAWVDTAPNYQAGSAQSLIAYALDGQPVPVSTKVGFLTPETAKAALADGALSADEAVAGHCLSSAYVHWQCARNRVELGRSRLDVVFVHNPERVATKPDEVLREAFAALEAEAAAGALDGYGVATWDGFDTGLLNVPHLDRLATEAAGTADHHLRTLQLPVSSSPPPRSGRRFTGAVPSRSQLNEGGRCTPPHRCSAANCPTWPPATSPILWTRDSASPRRAFWPQRHALE